MAARLSLRRCYSHRPRLLPGACFPVPGGSGQVRRFSSPTEPVRGSGNASGFRRILGTGNWSNINWSKLAVDVRRGGFILAFFWSLADTTRTETELNDTIDDLKGQIKVQMGKMEVLQAQTDG